MKSSAPLELEVKCLSEASEWHQRLNETIDDQVIEDWQAWLTADPRNAEAFEQMQEVWDGFGPTQPSKVKFDNAVFSALALTPQPPWLAAIAASLLLGLGALMWQQLARSGQKELNTGIGQQRHRTLADGSRLDLGADSHIRVQLGDTARTVYLQKGQAFFSVARDPSRPFTVHSGGLVITAVGTAFDVRNGIERTLVTVKEGRVNVTPEDGASPVNRQFAVLAVEVHVDAGERVTYLKPARRLTLTNVSPTIADSWRNGDLQFVAEPLREVVDEVNRYSSRKIVVSDENLSNMLFTGTVSQSRVEDWLKAIETVFPAKVEDVGAGEISIISRARANAAK